MAILVKDRLIHTLSIFFPGMRPLLDPYFRYFTSNSQLAILSLNGLDNPWFTEVQSETKLLETIPEKRDSRFRREGDSFSLYYPLTLTNVAIT